MKNMFKAIIKNWVIKYGFRWPYDEMQNGLFFLFWLKSLSFIILGFQSSPIFHQNICRILKHRSLLLRSWSCLTESANKAKLETEWYCNAASEKQKELMVGY